MEIKSNVVGKLLSFKIKDNKSITVKIKDENNNIHIYKGLNSFMIRESFKIGDVIGKIGDHLHYEVTKGNILDKYKQSLELINKEIELQILNQNKHTKYSIEYQEALSKEVALQKEKLNLMTARSNALEQEIIKNNVKLKFDGEMDFQQVNVNGLDSIDNIITLNIACDCNCNKTSAKEFASQIVKEIKANKGGR